VIPFSNSLSKKQGFTLKKEGLPRIFIRPIRAHNKGKNEIGGLSMDLVTNVTEIFIIGDLIMLAVGIGVFGLLMFVAGSAPRES
jgi:hypothetical protein